jgi:hypothetical protein
MAKKFLETADSRETSIELMASILAVADGNEAQAVRIWEDPSEDEMRAIYARVTQNGLHDASEFCWGAQGSKWANNITRD